jgi:hypothetical protein
LDNVTQLENLTPWRWLRTPTAGFEPATRYLCGSDLLGGSFIKPDVYRAIASRSSMIRSSAVTASVSQEFRADRYR